MSLVIAPVKDIYKYAGVTLEAPPGATVEKVKALYSAIYPELAHTEPEYGEVINGARTITYRRVTLRDKGATGVYAEFVDAMRAHVEGVAPPSADDLLLKDLQSETARRASNTLVSFARSTARGITLPSTLLPPLL